MIEQKYIGIENELISYKHNKIVPFDESYLKKIVKNAKYLENNDYDCIWSEISNLYYVDCCEIEIATPPIPLNKGFATRVTNSLIIGRNQIIKNTPHMKHTGYSMHWNLTRPENKRTQTYGEGIAIPFQLFGLTPTSCGFSIKKKSEGARFEIAGDSLTNEDQIQATALLLGAYNLASEKYDFPINILEVMNNVEPDSTIEHMLKLGRNTIINTSEKISSKHNQEYDLLRKETSVQNILEIFYEWLSPFVYKLGEREEVRNLEAFIKGDKKLEIDDIKYFYMVRKKGEEFFNKHADKIKDRFELQEYDSKIYQPVNIQTLQGKRSTILKVNNDIKIPLEGKLWQKSMNTEGFEVTYRSEEWDRLDAKINKKSHSAYSIHNIYKLLESVSKIKYKGSCDCSNIEPKIITQEQYTKIINNKTPFAVDNSAIIKDTEEFNNYLIEKLTN